MAWERRKRGGMYYYRSVRVNGRVRKIYCGGGLAGQAAAALDASARRERGLQAVAARQCRKAYKHMLEPLSILDGIVRALMAISLISAGHEYHRNRWRKCNEG